MILEKRNHITEAERKQLVEEGVIIIETNDTGIEIEKTDKPDRRVILVQKKP